MTTTAPVNLAASDATPLQSVLGDMLAIQRLPDNPGNARNPWAAARPSIDTLMVCVAIEELRRAVVTLTDRTDAVASSVADVANLIEAR